MRVINFLSVSAVIGAMTIAPAFAKAAEPDYMWGASHRAAGLLQNIREEASQIGDRAMVLNSQGGLRDLEMEISDLDNNLQRMQNLEAEIVPAEQAAIAQAKPVIQRMRVSLAQLISSGDGEQPTGNPSVQTDQQNLKEQAELLAREVNAALPLAHSENEQMYLARNAPFLQQNLGMLPVFGK